MTGRVIPSAKDANGLLDRLALLEVLTRRLSKKAELALADHDDPVGVKLAEELRSQMLGVLQGLARDISVLKITGQQLELRGRRFDAVEAIDFYIGELEEWRERLVQQQQAQAQAEVELLPARKEKSLGDRPS